MAWEVTSQLYTTLPLKGKVLRHKENPLIRAGKGGYTNLEILNFLSINLHKIRHSA